MNIKKTIFSILLLAGIQVLSAQTSFPKREFRGAWIQCVNGQFQNKPADAIKKTLITQLDTLHAAGINAIIFQIRAEADALYQSPYEPWSRFLTGIQGVAPQARWDPLQFMIDECHKRCMELHAWINPYRAKTKGTGVLAANHPYNVYPDLFVSYEGQLYFDPGFPESRKYICKIVRDIVHRYDVDAIHMDDYFYPYPVPGVPFPDDTSFGAYGVGYSSRAEWRRNNVNKLIEELHHVIREEKPWVKFGISPFGIYRNENSMQTGSRTRGLQNYNDLYADVLLWVNKGWIDYNIPQVYWEIGHPAADYDTLVKWWADNASNRPLYIGQDVKRTVGKADPHRPTHHQMRAKYNLQRSLSDIQGSCQWYSSAVMENPGNYRTILKNEYHRYPALQPLATFIDKDAPRKVRKLKDVWTEYGYMLFWTAPKAKKEMDKAVQYVVYRFKKGEKVNTDDASHIVAITRDTHIQLPYEDGKAKYKYVVTALDRLNNESNGESEKVRL